jgi:hypothetical protein
MVPQDQQLGVALSIRSLLDFPGIIKDDLDSTLAIKFANALLELLNNRDRDALTETRASFKPRL